MEATLDALMCLVYERVKGLCPFKLFSWSQNTDSLLQFMTNSRFHYSWTSKVPNPEKDYKTRYTSILLYLEPKKMIDRWVGRLAALGCHS